MRPARVLAVGPGLPPEAGRPAGVVPGAGGEVEHLVEVHAGERHLGGADEVEVVALDPVDLLVVLAQEAGALHRLRLDQRGSDDRGEAGGHRPADRQLGEGELEQRARTGEEVEPRPGHLGAALHVDRAEQLADLEVVAHREVVAGHLADGADRDRVVLAAGRHLVGDDVRDRQVDLAERGVGLAQLLLGLLHLGREGLGPFQDGGALLRAGLLHRLGSVLLLGLAASPPAALQPGDRCRRRGACRPRTRQHPAHAGWHGRRRGAHARIAGRSLPDGREAPSRRPRMLPCR